MEMRARVGEGPASRPLTLYLERTVTEAVADPSDRLDRVVAELLAQGADVDVDDVGPRLGVVAPHPRQDLVSAEHLSRMAHQHLEQRELASGQVEAICADRRP